MSQTMTAIAIEGGKGPAEALKPAEIARPVAADGILAFHPKPGRNRLMALLTACIDGSTMSPGAHRE